MSEELIKAGAGALEKLTDLLHRLAGPAAEELGETLRDSLKAFRFKRQLRLMRRIEEMAKEAKFNVKSVPLRLLFPAMDQATIEEDDCLQDLWAALITNAADPRQQFPVQTYFVDILRQLTKDQALFLQAVYHELIQERAERSFLSGKPKAGVIYAGVSLRFPTDQQGAASMSLSDGAIRGIYNKVLREISSPTETAEHLSPWNSGKQLAVALDNLMRLGLMRNRTALMDGSKSGIQEYYVTPMGYDFVRSCTAPTEQYVVGHGSQ